MFETNQFVEQLTNEIARSAGQHGMKEYETGIINFW